VHAGQKTGTQYAREIEAYTEGERFAISYGLRGKTGLRTTAASGAQEPDPAKVDKYVRKRYGGPRRASRRTRSSTTRTTAPRSSGAPTARRTSAAEGGRRLPR
jgi:hypothetical protein